MAGGIDWFRWHHGSVTDPKFQLVAKKAGVRLGDVILVWAFVLEKASENEQRGTIGPIDFETLDFMLGADDGTAGRILDAMTGRGLIGDGRIAAWDKRQPKREDDSATDRKRKQRELESVQVRDELLVPLNPDESRDVTQSHDRGEESREEKRNTSSPTDLSTAKPPTCPHRAILDLYAKHLPMLPQPKPELWAGQREKNLASRWKWLLTKTKTTGARYATNEAEGLAWFDRFFAYVAKSDFLTGRDGRWTNCDLGWLVNAENFAKVVQGNYENREAA
jgi:hypothetical protein